MREIKFRGVQLYTGEWHTGNLVVAPCGRTFIGWGRVLREQDLEDVQFFSIEVDPATVGQFTGLKDEDGSDIYEGDILMLPGGRKAPLSYNAPSWKVGGPESWQQAHYRLTRTESPMKGYTVIGNIHDNPELLEK